MDHPVGLVVLYDAATGQPKQSIAEPKVTNLYLSPKGTYVVTMRRYEKDDMPMMDGPKDQIGGSCVACHSILSVDFTLIFLHQKCEKCLNSGVNLVHFHSPFTSPSVRQISL